MTVEAYIPWLIKRVLLEEQHIKKKNKTKQKKTLGCQGGRTSVSESMFSNSLASHSVIWERRTYASLAQPA